MNNKTSYLTKNYWESELLAKDVYNLRFNSNSSKNRGKINKEITSLRNNSMVYVRFPIDEIDFKKHLQKIGFYKVDTYIDLRIMRNEGNHQVNKNYSLIEFQKSDLQNIRVISGEIFKHSRFHNDKNISRSEANKSRIKWFEDSIHNKNKKIYTYSLKEKVIGFLIEKNTGRKKTIDLIGISNKFQKQGHGDNLLKLYLNNIGDNTIHVGTQLDNTTALNLYLNNGFKFYKAFNTFHLHL